MSEFETEYAPGLPERLPEGERLLWRGRPRWRSLAIDAFHVRSVAIYFAILMVWRGGAVLAGGGVASAAVAMAWMMSLAFAAIALLALLAWLSARATIYTITDRRIVMRIGIALPITLNIPFRVVEGAALLKRRDASGDIAIKLGGSDRFAFLVLWPHARPWRINRPEPMLRSLAKSDDVAKVLARALDAAAGQPAQPQPNFVAAAPAAASRPLAAAAG